MGSSPQVVDWNSDGKLDIVSGDREGYYNFFIDTSSAGPKVLRAYYQRKLMDSTIIDVGYNSQPTITDWNRDGKKDLILGTSPAGADGYIWLYLNQTTDNWPMFQAHTNIVANGNAIYLDRPDPYVFDLDQDGKRDLVVGSNDGFLRFYRNIGTDTNIVLAYQGFLQTTAGTPIQPDGSYGSRCGFGDWNNDGLVDFLLSGYNGTVQLYLGYQSKNVGVTKINAPSGLITSTNPVIPQALVKNFGATAQSFSVTFKIGDSYNQTRTKTLAGGIEDTVNFLAWTPAPGNYATRCSTYLTNDSIKTNDTISGSVTVQIGGPGWQRMADVLLAPSGQAPKNGSCITGLNGNVYLLKATNKPDFYSFTPDASLGFWTSLTPMPLGTKKEGDGKNPKKGAALAAFGDKVYALRGSKTAGFWAYITSGTPGWQKLANILMGASYPKDGSGLAYVDKAGENGIFAMKGAKTSEFYFYSITNNTWSPLASPSTGGSGKLGYKKGSCLAYDDDSLVYVMKGTFGDFFKYNVLTNTWTELKRYDPAIFLNREMKKKKVKDGAGLAYMNGAVYLMKGGNTLEFWKYDILTNNWLQMNPATEWDIPLGGGKKVKGGGSLCIGDNFFYALKGGNTVEFYRHMPVIDAAATDPQPTANQNTLESKGIVNRRVISIEPNPVKDYATVRYNLLNSGPVSIKLYNAYGKLMKSYTSQTNQGEVVIDARELNSGIYLLRLNTGNSTLTRKIVLEK